MNRHRILAIARKELMHIVRDPFTLALALGLPLVMVVFFGFAIDFDFRDIRLAVYDFDHSRLSRQLVTGFTSSGYFIPQAPGRGFAPIEDVTAERSFAALVISPGFGRDIMKGAAGTAQLLVDGSNNQKAGIVGGYFAGIAAAFNQGLSRPADDVRAPPLDCRVRFLYNPELNTRWFIVPGLMVVVTGLLSILLTALTVAREWENGSMELLLSTPVTPVEVIIGKILPYIALVLTGLAFVYAIARAVFGIPFLGSHLWLAAACFLFIVVSLAQGIMISIVTRNQQKAMQAALLAGLLPSLLLSGFIFPVENMPPFFHYFTMILPPRWFMTIIRALFLKGAGPADLAVPFAVLTVMMLGLIAAATKRSKRDLE